MFGIFAENWKISLVNIGNFNWKYRISAIKVFNSKEVGEVQEGADSYCDKKL